MPLAEALISSPEKGAACTFSFTEPGTPFMASGPRRIVRLARTTTFATVQANLHCRIDDLAMSHQGW